MLLFVALILDRIAVSPKQSNPMQTVTANGVLHTQALERKRCPIFSLIQDHLPDTRFMKQPIEKPSEAGMKFFTPELYIAFNSPKDEEADRADAMWEEQLRVYRHHLENFRKNMSPGLQILSDLSLHDAEILALQDTELLGSKLGGQPIFRLILQRDEKVIILNYFLWDQVRQLPPTLDWHFSKSCIHWLYDEFDSVNGYDDLFWHRILMSNGTIIEIPARDVFAIAYSRSAETAT